MFSYKYSLIKFTLLYHFFEETVHNNNIKQMEVFTVEKNRIFPESGYMTNNMEDVIWLGKQMERLRDGEQLEEDNRIPDPIQSDVVDNPNKDERLKRRN